ncbi:hypothetical protein PsYK624_098470 [Phanerochaete sordida]|uniref:Uncharacterized protein n=1 Tax=Phanerochaete sordida TaxID=48140 RepID=A0A9P3LH30_9APHY|nr:hypothetical protein PsYK624_098470 [Phanerochaete sordida]
MLTYVTNILGGENARGDGSVHATTKNPRAKRERRRNKRVCGPRNDQRSFWDCTACVKARATAKILSLVALDVVLAVAPVVEAVLILFFYLIVGRKWMMNGGLHTLATRHRIHIVSIHASRLHQPRISAILKASEEPTRLPSARHRPRVSGRRCSSSLEVVKLPAVAVGLEGLPCLTLPVTCSDDGRELRM